MQPSKFFLELLRCHPFSVIHFSDVIDPWIEQEQAIQHSDANLARDCSDGKDDNKKSDADRPGPKNVKE